MVGVGMELLHHDGEVGGDVVEDDAGLVLSVCGRACNAHAHVPNDEATNVFHVCFALVLTVAT